MDPEPRQSLLAGKVEDAERGTDHAAVKAHASVPQLQNGDRVFEIIRQVVEQNVADAPAKDNPERRIEYEVVRMASGQGRTRLFQKLQQVPVTNEDSGKIG